MKKHIFLGLVAACLVTGCGAGSNADYQNVPAAKLPPGAQPGTPPPRPDGSTAPPVGSGQTAPAVPDPPPLKR